MLIKLENLLNKKWVVAILIATAALLVYSNSFTAPFTLDDFGSIVNNYSIRNPLNIGDIWKFYSNRFVLYFSISINYFIHDGGVVGYHITNVAIHIINGILVFFILKNILSLIARNKGYILRYSNIISICGALVFVCHPIQVNAVTYIIQRTASLASMFYFIAVLLFVKYRTTSKIRYFIGVMVSMVLAMFTKENTITLPFMLLLIEVFFFIKDGKTTWKKRIIMFVIIFLTLPIIPGTSLLHHLTGAYSQSDPGVTFKASTDMDRFQYFYTELNVMVLYLRQIVFPDKLNFDYSNDFPVSHTIFENYSYISGVFLLGMILAGFLTLRRNKLILFGILWFFLGLSVESTFISIKDVYFEHRLYFPIVGIIIAVIGIVFMRTGKPYKRYVFERPVLFLISLSIVLIFTYSTITLKRNYVFSDNIRLWTDVAAKASKSDRAHCSLGTAYLNYYENNDSKPAFCLNYAENELKKSIEINYTNATSHCNLAKVYLLKKNYNKCVEEALETNWVGPSQYSYYNLGMAYEKLNRQDDAIKAYKEGIKLDNKFTFILRKLADLYYDRKDFSNAEYYYKEFLKYSKSTKDKKAVNERLGAIHKE